MYNRHHFDALSRPDKNNYYLIDELSGHYYDFNGSFETLPEIARRLNNGTFFDARLSPYQQRKLVLTDYARYREYPRP